MALPQKGVFSRRSALRPLDPFSETQTMNLTACSAWHQKDSLHRMSLTDKESDASKALRLLIIGSRQKEIDLTRDHSPFLIRHSPASCPSCIEWYQQVRDIGTAHPALFDKDGWTKPLRGMQQD